MHKRFFASILIGFLIINASMSTYALGSLDSTTINQNPILLENGCCDVVYSAGDTAAILRDNRYVGWMKVNFIQKLDLWDWYVKDAVTNNVKHSYAINITVNLAKMMKSTKQALLTPTILLENEDGKIIGKSSQIGWSGFSKNITLYNNDTDGTFELILQPTVTNIPENSKIIICFEESGYSYKNIEFYIGNLNELKTIKSLRNSKEPVTIESSNGGKFTLSIDDVALSYNSFIPTSEGSASKHKQLVYDITARIRYDEQPKTNVVSSRFRDKSMSTSLVFAIQGDIDSSLLYEYDNSLLAKTALYGEYSTGEKFFRKYVYEPYSNLITSINLGEMTTVVNNRIVTQDSKAALEYVRVILEFPEELTSNKIDKNFVGRYVVYQMPISIQEEVFVDE